jgi:hypothetical protein
MNLTQEKQINEVTRHLGDEYIAAIQHDDHADPCNK